MAKKTPKKRAPDTAPPSISAGGSQTQGTTGGNARATPTKRKPVRRRPDAVGIGAGPSNDYGSGGAPAPVSAAGPAPVATQDPLAPMSLAQMIKAATDAAMGSVQPQLNSIDQDSASALSAHNARGQQLQGYADWSQGNLNSAFDSTRDALNSLITTQGTVDQASKDSLAAALRGGTASTDAAASGLGAATPTNLAPVLGSSADSAKSMELGTGAGAGALLGMMGAQKGLPSIGLQQNQGVEAGRYNAITQDLGRKKTDIMGTVPQLVQQNLKDQQAFELAKRQFGQSKANDLFQQYLAEQELGLKKKDQTFQQWLATSQLDETKRSNQANEGITSTQNANQNAIDWANVGINRTQAEGTLAQIKADAAKEKDGKKKEALKARGDAISKGLEWLSGYMVPSKGQSTSHHGNYPYGGAVAGSVDDPATALDESDPKQNPNYQEKSTEYKRTYADALRGLTQYMSRSDALRILKKSEYSDWRDKANVDYSRLKRRGVAGYSKGHGKPD